jgi:X-X-X-Leu-X-X-Gly heptad repeat protein
MGINVLITLDVKLMVANEAHGKRVNEYIIQIEELQKEVKKLKEMNDGLVKTQIKILQNALSADQESVLANEETIANGKRITELSCTVEKSAEEVSKLALYATETITKVTESARAVGEVASKVYGETESTAKAAGQVLEMGKQAASVSNQMAIGMQQVSTASQQVAVGAQKLADLSQSAARSTETLKRVMDEAGIVGTVRT